MSCVYLCVCAYTYITRNQGTVLARCEKMLREANEQIEVLQARAESAEKECSSLRAAAAGAQQHDWDVLKEAETLRIKVLLRCVYVYIYIYIYI